MSQKTFGFQLSPDNASLTISMREDDCQLTHVSVTASEVEKLIQILAGFRRRMIPEVSRTLQDGQLEGELNPLWVIPTRPSSPDKVLAIRHFGMGWLSFFFPPNSASQLARALLGQSSSQNIVQPPSTGRPH
jgi:hypothetical protein